MHDCIRIKKNSEAYKPGSVPSRAPVINLEARITAPFSRALPSDSSEQPSNVGLHELATHSMLVPPSAMPRLVSMAVTKHCCLPAVNRCGALCCPDFPHRLAADATDRPAVWSAKLYFFFDLCNFSYYFMPKILKIFGRIKKKYYLCT